MIRYRLILFALSLCMMFCGCAVNPVTGENQLMLVSPEQELQIGTQYAPEIEKQLEGRIDNTALQNYVSNVGQNISRISHMPQLEFRYIAVNHKMINAMALPGGYIFITKGMLEKLDSEAQLAAILAHETAHVTARHSAQAMTTQIGLDIVLSAVSRKTAGGTTEIARIGSQLIGLKYSRGHEAEADTVGLDYLAKAGYSPFAAVETMEILERENQARQIEFLSSHPSPVNRKDNLLRQINLKGYSQNMKVGQSEYRSYVLANLKD
jgi:predicted Zn-dependent protease